VIADTKPEESPRADVFDLLNIVPYVRKFKSSERAIFFTHNVDRSRSCIWKAARHISADQAQLLQGTSTIWDHQLQLTRIRTLKARCTTLLPTKSSHLTSTSSSSRTPCLSLPVFRALLTKVTRETYSIWPRYSFWRSSRRHGGIWCRMSPSRVKISSPFRFVLCTIAA